MAEEQAQQFIEQATQSVQNGQFVQALDLADQAIALDATSSEAYVIRGIALSQTNQPGPAKDAFQKAIELAPDNVKAYFNLSVHCYTMGEKQAAYTAAANALRIDPQHTAARDMVNRITAEGHAPASSDPIPPTPGQMGVAPTMGPPPSQQPAGYYRPGYEASAHSITFIRNMGKKWDTLGWTIGSVSFALFLIQLPRTIQVWSLVLAMNMAELQKMNANASAFYLILGLVALAVRICTMVWMIMELADRRGNWLWLLPFVFCCCVGLEGPVLGVYLASGRK